MKESIYTFVKSLSMSEKAYFKRQAKAYSASSTKNYLRLFDAIDQMKEYDKDELKKRFAGETIGKYISSECNYLFDQILRSLVNFNFDRSLKKKLQKATLYIDILIEKGFSKRALKELHKAKAMAYRSEDFSTILKLIKIEEEELFIKGILGFTDQLAILSEERLTINNQISNLNQFRLMREQIRELQFSDIPIKDISNHPHFVLNALSDEGVRPLSLKAKQHWYYIHTVGYYIIGEYDKAKAISDEYIKLLEDHDYLFKKLMLVTAISNHLYHCALSKDEVAYAAMLSHLNRLENDPSYDQVFISYIRYARGLELYYRLGDLPASQAMIADVKQFMSTDVSDLGTTQANYLYFLSVRTCLILGQWETAIDWLNAWQNHGVLTYTLMYSRIFSLILHLELGWTDLLEAEINAAYKDLRKKSNYDDLSRAFLLFFRHQIKYPNQVAQSLEHLEISLVKFYKDMDRNQTYEYFDFLKWCRDKRKRL